MSGIGEREREREREREKATYAIVLKMPLFIGI